MKKDEKRKINIGFTVLKIFVILLFVSLLTSKTVMTIIETKGEISETEQEGIANIAEINIGYILSDDETYVIVTISSDYEITQIEVSEEDYDENLEEDDYTFTIEEDWGTEDVLILTKNFTENIDKAYRLTFEDETSAVEEVIIEDFLNDEKNVAIVSDILCTACGCGGDVYGNCAYQGQTDNCGCASEEEEEEDTTTYYSVTYNLTHATKTSGATSIASGSALTAYVTASSGYTLPSSITITVGGSTLSTSKYTYSSSTGRIYISSTYVTGNIVITVVATEEDTTTYYSVTYNLTGATRTSGATSVAEGSSFSAYVTASSGYTLPSSITIIVGGSTLSTSKYTYSSSTGYIYISSTYVTGNIVITVVATAETYTVTYNLTGVSKASGSTSITAGSALTAYVTADEGYTLPTSITVKVGSTTLSSSYYTYSTSTGRIYLASSRVTGNITITVTRSPNHIYNFI